MVSQTSSKTPQHLILLPTLSWRGQSVPVAALLDSGVEDNFIDGELVKQLGIPTEPLESPLESRSLNGLRLFQVLHRTVPVSLIRSRNHGEKTVFHLIDRPCSPLVLGYPWLCRHNPQIDWTRKEICSWSTTCHAQPDLLQHQQVLLLPRL